MEKPDFSLTLSPQQPQCTVARWVWLAVATLAVSGLGPLILLAGRASSFAEKSFIKNTFAEALVVHVNLSAVAWFLAIALLFWALFGQPRRPLLPVLRGGALGCFGAGVACVAAAPLLGGGAPLFSNYIPMYTTGLFTAGLLLMAAALALGLLDIRLARSMGFNATPAQAAQHFGILGSAFIVLLALIHFAWAYSRVDMNANTQDYYELLFWAGGHVLQLAYTQLLLVAWLWLASAAGLPVRLSGKWLLALFSIYPLVALTSPLGFLNDSQPYDLYFYTLQMRHGGGLGAAALGLYLLWLLMKSGKPTRENLLPWVFLVTSMTVFLVGGAIGHVISGVNTIIPAHYHGSIVGTTLAFMGVIYLLLPRLGYASLARSTAAWVQPLLYGSGSVMHAMGFAIAGGHGAERKAVGIVQDAPLLMEIALKMVHYGGGLAILGGAMFVVLAVRTGLKKPG